MNDPKERGASPLRSCVLSVNATEPNRSVSTCAAAPVGKRLPNDLYVHRSVEDDLNPKLIPFQVQRPRRRTGGPQ